LSSTLPNIRTGTPFHRDLQQRVADHFRATGASRKGNVRLWTKTAVMLAWLVGSYLGFLLLAQGVWLTIVFGISMGLAIAGIGFNVQHDGNQTSCLGSTQSHTKNYRPPAGTSSSRWLGLDI